MSSLPASSCLRLACICCPRTAYKTRSVYLTSLACLCALVWSPSSLLCLAAVVLTAFTGMLPVLPAVMLAALPSMLSNTARCCTGCICRTDKHLAIHCLLDVCCTGWHAYHTLVPCTLTLFLPAVSRTSAGQKVSTPSVACYQCNEHNHSLIQPCAM